MTTKPELRILLALRSFEKYTGSELYTYYLARELIKCGYHVELYAHFTSGEPLTKKCGGLKYVSGEELSGRRTHEYDVVLAMQRHTIQYVLDHVEGVPLVTVHHGRIELERAVVDRRISRYICVSEEIKQKALEEWGVPGDRITVIPNFVDLNEYQQRKPRRMRKRIYLLWGGTIYDYYRDAVQAAIEITRRIPHARLNLVGEDHLNLASEHGSRRVRFLGPRRITSRLLAKHHLVFGRGRIALECLAAGVPVYILGNEGSDGLLSESNCEALSRTNFSGRSNPLAYSPESIGIMAKEIEDIVSARNDGGGISSCYASLSRKYDLQTGIDRIRNVIHETVSNAGAQRG